MLGQQGPSCLLGECRNTLSVKWSGSWLPSLPPGTFPNCISQQEGWRAISLLVPSQAFPVEEYSSVASTPCTQTSQAEGEKPRFPSALTAGLHWEKINQRNGSTSPPAPWKERPGSTGKAEGYEQKQSRWKIILFLLAPQEVPNYWACSCWRIFWQHGPVSTWTFTFEINIHQVVFLKSETWISPKLLFGSNLLQFLQNVIKICSLWFDRVSTLRVLLWRNGHKYMFKTLSNAQMLFWSWEAKSM